MKNATATKAITPCPDWCTDDHSQETSYHVQVLASGSVTVDILGAIDDGSWLIPVPVGVSASLWIGEHDEINGLKAAECREVATALLAAADKLDEINAEVSA